MSDIPSPARDGAAAKVSIGLLRLTDSAPVIVAHEFGFFADEGLDVALSIEPSWANIADKLAYGALDAAVVVPPLAFAVSLGLRGPAQSLMIPYSVSLGGNTITLATGLAKELRTEARKTGFAAALAAWLKRSAAERIGVAVATSNDVWRDAPEKALAVRERWSEAHPEALRSLLRALYRAARFCDAPDNSTYVAALLSRRAWLGVDSHAILQSLPGALGSRNQTRFHAHAATYPWRSHALWFLVEMQRWGLIEAGRPLRDIARRVYRPDLYADALAPAGAPIPASDMKSEGEHVTAWSLPASPGPIAMGPDLFCDGVVFDPARAL